MSVLEALVFCARAPTGAKFCAAHQALARRAGTAARLAFACRGMPRADARKPVGALPCGGTTRHTAWKSRNADCRTRWMPPAAAHAYRICIFWAPADPALWPVLSPRVRCLRFAARLPCALLQVLHCGCNDAGSHACCRTCAASGFAITAPGAWHAPLGHVDRVQPDDDDGCLWWRDGRAAPAPREPAQVLGAPRCGRAR